MIKSFNEFIPRQVRRRSSPSTCRGRPAFQCGQLRLNSEPERFRQMLENKNINHNPQGPAQVPSMRSLMIWSLSIYVVFYSQRDSNPRHYNHLMADLRSKHAVFKLVCFWNKHNDMFCLDRNVDPYKLVTFK